VEWQWDGAARGTPEVPRTASARPLNGPKKISGQVRVSLYFLWPPMRYCRR
jgi:hypothetical protein